MRRPGAPVVSLGDGAAGGAVPERPEDDVVLVVLVVPVLITVFLLAMEEVERVLVHGAPEPDARSQGETGGAVAPLVTVPFWTVEPR